GFVLLAAVVNFWPAGSRGTPAANQAPTATAPAAFTAPGAPTPPAGAREGARRESAAAPTAVPPPRQPVLRLASPRPASLDPAFAADAPSLDLALALFEGLVGLDATGQPYGVEAQRWEVSEDSRTYTFYLRDDLRWSNGEPLTAADYVFAWRRNVAPAFGTPAASSLT